MRYVIAVLAVILSSPGTAAAGRSGVVPPNTYQLVVVTATDLSAYARINGQWRAVYAGMPVRIGARGFSNHKHEGDRTTPTGLYPFGPTMFGLLPNPGVQFGYHRLVPGDYWNENAASPGYNTFTHGTDPGGPSEALWTISPQYSFFAVIDYNVPAVPGRGSGVFLHEMVPGHATAGCVALARADLVKILVWLHPGSNPRIALGPSARDVLA